MWNLDFILVLNLCRFVSFSKNRMCYLVCNICSCNAIMQNVQVRPECESYDPVVLLLSCKIRIPAVYSASFTEVEWYITHRVVQSTVDPLQSGIELQC